MKRSESERGGKVSKLAVISMRIRYRASGVSLLVTSANFELEKKHCKTAIDCCSATLK